MWKEKSGGANGISLSRGPTGTLALSAQQCDNASTMMATMSVQQRQQCQRNEGNSAGTMGAKASAQQWQQCHHNNGKKASTIESSIGAPILLTLMNGLQGGNSPRNHILKDNSQRNNSKGAIATATMMPVQQWQRQQRDKGDYVSAMMATMPRY